MELRTDMHAKRWRMFGGIFTLAVIVNRFDHIEIKSARIEATMGNVSSFSDTFNSTWCSPTIQSAHATASRHVSRVTTGSASALQSAWAR
jgi:hypothetical protein